MVRGTKVVFSRGSSTIREAFFNLLVCPLSKQPLRQCQDSQSLINDSLGISFPIVDGIPCLVPKDGKLLEDEHVARHADPSLVKNTP